MNPPKINQPLLSTRFEEALIFAIRIHANQRRKGTAIPYAAHLLGVASLVLEDGGDEDEAIAALLHDAVEDQGGMKILNFIRQVYGDKVADIVADCTDSFHDPKPPWRGRKEAYINHLPSVSTSVLRVSLADKLYNARALLMMYQEIGEKTWERFNGGREGTLWYYRSLLDVFKQLSHSPMVIEFDRVLNDLFMMASDNTP